MRSALAVLVLVVLAWPVAPRSASAQEDGPLRLMNEPIEYTDVIDAVDGDDPFDLNVSIGFNRTATTGTIRRERNDISDGRGSENFEDIAAYEHVRYNLTLGVDAGIFHDLMAFVRLPFVLSDTRKLDAPDSRSAAEVNAGLTDTDMHPSDGLPRQLFSVPFESPERSGLDYIEAGLAWGIFNQHRGPGYPTWVLMASGRFGVGEPMHACEKNADCPGGNDPGLTHGTNALHLETRASRRFRHFEPYGGLSFHIEWPSSSDSSFLPAGDLPGIMNSIPPRIGEMVAGIMLLPWEHRGRWQRFGVDLRIVATYVSEGHQYSPLFDALGTSQSRYLTEASNEFEDGSGRDVPFYGLTDVSSHGRIGGRFGLEMQAARYIRFSFGVGLFYDTPYFLTFADACNPNVAPTGDGDLRQGNCRTGIINPHYRSAIDLAGRRFRMDGDTIFDLYASAVGQF